MLQATEVTNTNQMARKGEEIVRILLAVDGSDASYEAVRALQHLSPAEELVVLYALNIPRLAYPATTPGIHKDFAVEVERAMREEGEQIMKRAASLLPPHFGSISKRIETGLPADVILSEAERLQADLIVLGSRGLGPIKELALGSVSHRITTHATCATLVVKSPMRRFRHVLVPVESPEDAKAVTAFFAKKPFKETVKVTALHVIPFAQPAWPVGVMLPESFRKEMVSEFTKFANEVATQLSSAGYPANGLAILGTPSVAILEKASAIEADLIVMRTQSRPAISRFFLGSVSHTVVHQANCSVLLIK